MAASAKSSTREKPNPTEEWTIVLPRHGKQRRKFPEIKTSEQRDTSWGPSDVETDPEREIKLMWKMRNYIKKLEESQFYRTFLDQIQTAEMLEYFSNVLGSESSMEMVVYGIGSIESSESSRWQLALAILMKRKFSWIGCMEVFDPVISLSESRVLEALGFSVLSVNEQGRRKATRPTLFFLPHCEAELYDHLLEANWRGGMLNRIVLFGNSFEVYEESLSLCQNSFLVDSTKHMLALKKYRKEFEIRTVSDDYFRAFNGSSWHFFETVVDEITLQFQSALKMSD
ncbi:hypothetical protein RJ639_044499 [Escallonia herrerae]|uniref:SRR1-like domain-containing protein n=1 Tax=Escallonia herrerae TaxID=1293975 RepID=A0AA88WCR0_9ASTE|nr:hypothetical protein RJ639_044499 [Escallonia herrerae]